MTLRDRLRLWLGIVAVDENCAAQLLDVRRRLFELEVELHRETTALAASLLNIPKDAQEIRTDGERTVQIDPHMGRY